MGSFSTENTSIYYNVRLAADAKHLEAKADKDAVTYLFFYHGTKGGEDLPVDVQVKRGAALAGNYRKGDFVNIEGQMTYELDKRNGKLKGKLYANKVTSLVKLKERVEEAPPAAEEPAPAEDLGEDAFA